jgi:hypothetical protein
VNVTPCDVPVKSAFWQTISPPVVLLKTFPHWIAQGEFGSASNAVVVEVKDMRRRNADAIIEPRILEAPSSRLNVLNGCGTIPVHVDKIVAWDSIDDPDQEAP